MDATNPSQPTEGQISPPEAPHISNGAGDTVNTWLKNMVEQRASDLHLRAGTPLIMRVDGNLKVVDKNVLTPEMAKERSDLKPE